jgi:hypothetical protein
VDHSVNQVYFVEVLRWEMCSLKIKWMSGHLHFDGVSADTSLLNQGF